MNNMIVGYWSDGDDNGYPDVRTQVDASWDEKEKNKVLHYLRNRVTRSRRFRGSSTCRICNDRNGSCEDTDGVYTWPEGFAHYIKEHDVKPTQAFITHVLING